MPVPRTYLGYIHWIRRSSVARLPPGIGPADTLKLRIRRVRLEIVNTVPGTRPVVI